MFRHPLPSPQTPFWWSEFSIPGPGDQPACYSSIRSHYSLPTRANLHFFYVDKHVSTFYPLSVPPWDCLARGTISSFHTEADINSRRKTTSSTTDKRRLREREKRRGEREALALALKEELFHSDIRQRAYHHTKLPPPLSTNLFKGTLSLTQRTNFRFHMTGGGTAKPLPKHLSDSVDNEHTRITAFPQNAP